MLLDVFNRRTGNRCSRSIIIDQRFEESEYSSGRQRQGYDFKDYAIRKIHYSFDKGLFKYCRENVPESNKVKWIDLFYLAEEHSVTDIYGTLYSEETKQIYFHKLSLNSLIYDYESSNTDYNNNYISDRFITDPFFYNLDYYFLFTRPVIEIVSPITYHTYNNYERYANTHIYRLVFNFPLDFKMNVYMYHHTKLMCQTCINLCLLFYEARPSYKTEEGYLLML